MAHYVLRRVKHHDWRFKAIRTIDITISVLQVLAVIACVLLFTDVLINSFYYQPSTALVQTICDAILYVDQFVINFFDALIFKHVEINFPNFASDYYVLIGSVGLGRHLVINAILLICTLLLDYLKKAIIESFPLELIDEETEHTSQLRP